MRAVGAQHVHERAEQLHAPQRHTRVPVEHAHARILDEHIGLREDRRTRRLGEVGEQVARALQIVALRMVVLAEQGRDERGRTAQVHLVPKRLDLRGSDGAIDDQRRPTRSLAGCFALGVGGQEQGRLGVGPRRARRQRAVHGAGTGRFGRTRWEGAASCASRRLLGRAGCAGCAGCADRTARGGRRAASRINEGRGRSARGSLELRGCLIQRLGPGILYQEGQERLRGLADRRRAVV